MLLQGDATAVAQAMEEPPPTAPASAEIRLSTQRSRLTRKLLDEMGLAEIEQIIANARRMPGGEGLADRLDAARRALAAEAQRYVERQHELYASGSGKALREEMLAKKALNADGGIDPVDLAMMQALVRKMAKRLADRYSRRRHKAHRGHLDVRKTLRRSHGLRRRAVRDRLEDQEGRQALDRGHLRRLEVGRRRRPVPADLPLSV